MPALTPVPTSQRFRDRALECRAAASRFRVDFARNQMLKVAEDFERIAQEAREREITQGISRMGNLVRDLHRAG